MDANNILRRNRSQIWPTLSLRGSQRRPWHSLFCEWLRLLRPKGLAMTEKHGCERLPFIVVLREQLICSICLYCCQEYLPRLEIRDGI